MINKHIEHLEDILFESPQRVKEILLDIVDDMEAGRYDNFSVKIDGSPSIIIGVEDGQFFVATKSLFNKVPVKYTKLSEFDSIKDPDLKDKLLSVFTNYEGTIQDGIYQGDLLFTEKTVELDSEDQETFITFRPNILVYRVYESVENPNIADLRIGVAWHTSYRREVSGELVRDSQAPIQSFFQTKKQILNIFPTYLSMCKGTWEDVVIPNTLGRYERMRKEINNMNFDKFAQTEHAHYLSKTFNHVLKRNSSRAYWFNKQCFDNDVREIAEQEISKRKTEKAKQRRRDHFEDVINEITQDHITLYQDVMGIKNLIYSYLFTPHKKSLTPDPILWMHEGFVYKDVKIVIRSMFSVLNFLIHPKNN